MFDFKSMKPKKPAPYQAYWLLYMDKVNEKLKPKYESYLNELAEGEKKCSWLSFVSEHATVMLAGEMEDVKKEVERYLDKATVEHPGLDLFTAREQPETSDVPADGQLEGLHKRAVEIQT